jgi:uncharacterized protein
LIQLRGHHLVCLHFYNGEGYGIEFIDTLREIRCRAEAGELIEVACGPDNVCTLCPYFKAGKCLYTADADTEITEMDQAAVELLKVITGERVHWRKLKENIPEIFGIWSKKYCKGCDWIEACEKDAQFKELTHRLHETT